MYKKVRNTLLSIASIAIAGIMLALLVAEIYVAGSSEVPPELAVTKQTTMRLACTQYGLKITIKFPKIITIKFNPNGGKVSQKSKNVLQYLKFGKLPLPTRDGYKFLGWWTAKSGGSKITDTTRVLLTRNKTYYAHWQKNKQTPKPVGDSAAATEHININTASSIELQKINGVGPSIADSIIAYRTKNGKFERIDDIKKVKGIGSKTYEKMKNQLSL
jgi:comEA protein